MVTAVSPDSILELHRCPDDTIMDPCDGSFDLYDQDFVFSDEEEEADSSFRVEMDSPSKIKVEQASSEGDVENDEDMAPDWMLTVTPPRLKRFD